jgi:metal-responsive CopG/Arc/MetJ family transcriptional regulator
MRKTSICITLDGDLINNLENDSKKDERSKSNIVNKILREYYKKLITTK